MSPIQSETYDTLAILGKNKGKCQIKHKRSTREKQIMDKMSYSSIPTTVTKLTMKNWGQKGMRSCRYSG